jgi:hypothetical protein
MSRIPKPLSLIQHRIPLISCTIACLLIPALADSKTFSAESVAETNSGNSQVHQQCITVAEWFRRYDEIRRRAEMTRSEKLQSFGLVSKRPDKRNAALASHMIQKYTMAVSAMKELESTPKTRELQNGYIEYFTTARKLMTDYLDAQEQVPITNQDLMMTKGNLEEVDKKNKKLDAELRKQFAIPRHKHS